jgi:hypothetical protein
MVIDLDPTLADDGDCGTWFLAARDQLVEHFAGADAHGAPRYART